MAAVIDDDVKALFLKIILNVNILYVRQNELTLFF